MKNEEVLDLIARNKKFYSVFFRAILLVYLLILAFAFLRMLSAFSSRGLGIEVVAVLYVLFLVTIWYLIVCFIVLVFWRVGCKQTLQSEGDRGVTQSVEIYNSP